ncbi:type II toxin-antitoxin system ParD family antitoxin [Paraneptunicella aestuarii]|uniref:type II toxin-antitoxin system ParD family antitoxin n=1 Tax=Paraneptunicella aestuarii TaxID=2831148 RepID=UPI001E3AD06A|nr:type II toxin-antitoxin system ParD family antitoxin [Paraneptunicella aestuarii]UAA39802.1 type II toxin-antitoxin system ParD family antitoxin [Paraneptunicella aestuarii]
MSQAKTQTLSLGEHWNAFIAAQIEDGRYASASEVVRDALRLMEEKRSASKLEQLRAALREGEESGDAGVFDLEAIKREALKEMELSK